MNNNSLKKTSTLQNEDKKRIQAVYEYLLSNTATATQVAVALSIYRPSVCRYKRKLEKAGYLKQVRKATCPVTKFKAWLITCAPVEGAEVNEY